MRDENTRNTIIFFVCAAIMLLAYQFFVADPQAKRMQAEEAARKAQAPAAAAAAAAGPGGPVVTGPGAPALPTVVSREAAVAASPRVRISTPALRGSLSLRGAQIDDLYLTQYREALPKNSPPVELLRPEGAPYAWFIDLGWAGANVPGLPNRQTLWTQTGGADLAPGRPVTLTYANGQGLTFTRNIAVDENYMFTVTDTVANTGTIPITLAPYGSVQRQGVPENLGKNGVVHEGAVGHFAEKLRLLKYAKWQKEGGGPEHESTGGWLGITDHYWLAALIPGPQAHFKGGYALTRDKGVNIVEAKFLGDGRVVGPNQQISNTMHVFAGAKKVPLLQAYQDRMAIPRFDEAVDWGMFWFLTRPVFQLLTFLFGQVGNFGVAILLLTVVVRLIMFPLANKQYESMTKMKKVQPAMEELRKQYKDDPPRQQQELMELYKREKVNPLAGCLPILITIPVFFSLFKVLQVDLDMRHAPFVGFIKDLSAPDPTTIWNLFGLIPWDPTTAPLIGGLLVVHPNSFSLSIGVMAIAYGFTTWLTTAMSPPAPDPLQQKMLQWMPVLFTFIMAGFPIGLLVYYTWSNVLTTLQQYVMMRKFKVDNPIDQFISKFTGQGPGHLMADADQPFDEEALEAARVFFAHPVTFMMGAVAISGLPPADLPEVAFAGRSNVGKSSLINAVTGRTHLARASTAPGRTREVNFFVADETLRLVDLPGYGFAKVSRGEANKFQNLGRSYLRGRPNLKRAYLLIDSRHGLKDVDAEAMDAFDLAAVSYQIILTKADKLRSQRDVDQVTAETQRKIAKRPAAFPRVLATSAEKGAGIPELRAEILAACEA